MRPQTYSLEELAARSAVSPRTIRYYIQLGLVDRPDGETRSATYGRRHLDQLLEIRKYQEGGLSLEQIRELRTSPSAELEAIRPRYPGTVEVWSRVTLADGVELHIEPGRARLTSEKVRALISKSLQAFESLKKESQ